MGYIEGVIIFLLAFIVIGPKDFPKVMFKVGDTWRRLKMMSTTFYEKLEEQMEDDTSEKK
jgi:Sec-independent protein translocase protein TatA